jgi:thioredoxin reductase (NADPH)
MSDEEAESIVVGAGPAGLSAAIYLARYNRSVVVFDSGHGRSTHHQVNHNYLGFPGGVPTVQLRELGRQQLAEYPHVTFHHHRVDAMFREGDGFVARSQAGDWYAPAVIVCTGVLDHYPHFEGWEDYVGRSMYWCLTCDGYANRGRETLVIGHTNGAAGEALQLGRFTDRLTLLTNSHTNEIDERYLERLSTAGIPVIHDKLHEATGEDGQLHSVTTVGGLTLSLEAMFCIQGATPETRLAQELGVSVADSGWIQTDEEQKTNVPGVYAAGDVTRLHSHQVTTAVHEGAQAASAANYYLYPPDLKAD